MRCLQNSLLSLTRSVHLKAAPLVVLHGLPLIVDVVLLNSLLIMLHMLAANSAKSIVEKAVLHGLALPPSLMVLLLTIRPGGGLSAKRSPRLAVGTRRKCFQHTRASKIPGNALQSKGPKAMTKNVAICMHILKLSVDTGTPCGIT